MTPGYFQENGWLVDLLTKDQQPIKLPSMSLYGVLNDDSKNILIFYEHLSLISSYFSLLLQVPTSCADPYMPADLIKHAEVITYINLLESIDQLDTKSSTEVIQPSQELLISHMGQLGLKSACHSLSLDYTPYVSLTQSGSTCILLSLNDSHSAWEVTSLIPSRIGFHLAYFSMISLEYSAWSSISSRLYHFTTWIRPDLNQLGNDQLGQHFVCELTQLSSRVSLGQDQLTCSISLESRISLGCQTEADSAWDFQKLSFYIFSINEVRARVLHMM